MPATLRTFVAIPLTGSIRRTIGALIAELASSRANVKWVDESNLHLTLQFLGEVHPDRLPEICDTLVGAVEQSAAYEVHVGSVGAFPKSDRPRTVWVGLVDGDEQTVGLQSDVSDALAGLGFRPERRRFRPHITIGRVRRSRPDEIEELGGEIGRHDSFSAGAMRVDRVVLFSSRLGRDGPSYDILATAPLA